MRSFDPKRQALYAGLSMSVVGLMLVIGFAVPLRNRPTDPVEWILYFSLFIPFVSLIISAVVRRTYQTSVELQSAHRRSSGRCAECGYDLRASSDRCSECGTLTASPPKPAPSPKPIRPLRRAAQGAFFIIVILSIPLFYRLPTFYGGSFWERINPIIVINVLVVIGIGVWNYRLAVKAEADRRRQLGLCVKCAYDLRASAGACPECGSIPPKLEDA